MVALQSLMTTDPAQRFAYGLDAFVEGVASQLRPAPLAFGYKPGVP